MHKRKFLEFKVLESDQGFHNIEKWNRFSKTAYQVSLSLDKGQNLAVN